MDSERSCKGRGSSSGRGCPPISMVLALILVACLVECASVSNRGGKPLKLVDKINGWRSQRGGSCLSYGHSCWGAHGKRSPKSSSGDLTRILQRLAANSRMFQERPQQELSKDNDYSAILQSDEKNEHTNTNQLANNADSQEILVATRRDPEAIPMLDDEFLNKINLWRIMRESAEKK